MFSRCDMRPGIVAVALALAGAPLLAADEPQPLPEGFVRGDVVSYSYVPIRTYHPDESIGILPYLCEYYLMKWDGDRPLSDHHAENIRRIDIASQWSTVIMLYARYDDWHDELINLMLRCYANRQLIIIRDYWPGRDTEAGAPPYSNLRHILTTLWNGRDREFVSPEGDRATGRQLTNNVLACKCGDEGEAGLGTEGLARVYREFDQQVRLLELDGERPFAHIKAWYNMIGYAALDYNGAYAASQADVDLHGRMELPANTQAIGVDVYHYWGIDWSPFDPADLSIPRERVRAHSDEWQRLRTRYYPEGLEVRVGENSSDPATWKPEYWNDTHALMSAIELAHAEDAMMWYIAVSGQIVGADPPTYTTPIETMQAYYDELKAGPWSGLVWWIFGATGSVQGGLDYCDRTLVHCTPRHPGGVPYSEEILDYWHDAYVEFKRGIFEDVVYGQFGHLNPRPKAEAADEDGLR
jgi:hypothetical protein